MKKASFYEKIKLLLQQRKQTPLQCVFYWPKDDQESSFNDFLLKTVKKYIDSQDFFQLLRKRFLNKSQQDDSVLFQKLEEMGEKELSNKFAAFFKKSEVSLQNSTLTKIEEQLSLLNSSFVPVNEKRLEKKVKRLVKILNVLQTFIVITANEEEKPKNLDPRDFKRYEVECLNYVADLTIQMKKIEDYKKQSLKLREILHSKEASKLQPQSKSIDYCNKLETLINSYVNLKSSFQDISRILKTMIKREKKEAVNLNYLIEKLPFPSIKNAFIQLQKSISQNSPEKYQISHTSTITNKFAREKVPQQNYTNTYRDQQKSQNQQLLRFKSEIVERFPKNQRISRQQDQILKKIGSQQDKSKNQLKLQIENLHKILLLKDKELQSIKEQNFKLRQSYQSKLARLSQKTNSQLKQLKALFTLKQKRQIQTNQRLRIQVKAMQQKYFQAISKPNSQGKVTISAKNQKYEFSKENQLKKEFLYQQKLQDVLDVQQTKQALKKELQIQKDLNAILHERIQIFPMPQKEQEIREKHVGLKKESYPKENKQIQQPLSQSQPIGLTKNKRSYVSTHKITDNRQSQNYLSPQKK